MGLALSWTVPSSSWSSQRPYAERAAVSRCARACAVLCCYCCALRRSQEPSILGGSPQLYFSVISHPHPAPRLLRKHRPGAGSQATSESASPFVLHPAWFRRGQSTFYTQPWTRHQSRKTGRSSLLACTCVTPGRWGTRSGPREGAWVLGGQDSDLPAPLLRHGQGSGAHGGAGNT